MATYSRKHIKRIAELKSLLSGSGPDRLKNNQVAIQKDGSTYRLAFRDELGVYHELANVGEAAGPTGPGGYTGPGGHTGAQGASGALGVQGETGVQGPAGATGVKGIEGIQGETGVQGSAGDQGETGPQGAVGPQGSTGFQGSTGSQGDTGLGVTGPQGDTGLQGSTGSQGDTGPQGDTGLGDQGVTGVQGDTGAVAFFQYDAGTMTGDKEINWSLGKKQEVTISDGAAGSVFYFTNGIAGSNTTLIIDYDVNQIPTFTGLYWSSGTQTSLTGQTGVYDILSSYADGSRYFVQLSTNFTQA
ncbi:MAG: hypothetical protein GF334_00150 [Candidatus Altiarchaeales archaeon]|nr:hypothetical protein [Candidatus Altiarchaeales archaeon]